MNYVCLTGRLTRDPEERGKATKYTLAVDRKFKGDQDTDFINCVCFGKTGEFATKYLKKGTKILIEGHLQSGSYTNRDGNKVNTTDVIIESHEFVEPRKSQKREDSPARGRESYRNDESDGFLDIPEDEDPFA